MNPSKRERWPVAKGTRHVWVLGDHRYDVPVQGYIVERRKRGREWMALVAQVVQLEGEQVLVHRWVPMSRLRPVFSTPEDQRERPY